MKTFSGIRKTSEIESLFQSELRIHVTKNHPVDTKDSGPVNGCEQLFCGNKVERQWGPSLRYRSTAILYTDHIPERRAGGDRRSRVDRRCGEDRRNENDQTVEINQRSGLDRRAAFQAWAYFQWLKCRQGWCPDTGPAFFCTHQLGRTWNLQQR